MGKGQIKITAGSHDELSSAVLLGDDRYLVQTERTGPKKLQITTSAYLKGKIVSRVSTNHSDMEKAPDLEERILDSMKRQHRSVMEMLTSRKKEEKKESKEEAFIQPVFEEKSPADYLKTVKTLLMRKNQRAALDLLREAVEQHPEDPFIISYLGCLEAIVDKKFRIGIDTCKKAMVLLKKRVPFGEDFLYPVFYLNLGRAYLASGKKKEALDAFMKGLETDRENSELLMELKLLGARKKPPVPFLKRSNPINKYIGMMLRKAGM